ncbi:MAG: hypothetical protein ACJ8GO_11575, partial [Ramlibacter sp.]
LHDLNFVAPDVSPTKPGATTETLKAGSTFRQAGARVLTAEKFTQDVLEMPSNAQTKFLGYNFYKPEVQPGAKVPLVVFLHGSGQSHDYKHFPTDFKADVLSPLLANQGGVAWVERAKEKAFVLVPQAPARDTADSAGERGWRSADTQKLLLALVDKVIAENPAIDTQRLYLTGLSMGAMGSWKIITNPDSAVSRKFASAVLFNGGPRKTFGSEPGETLEQMDARIAPELKQVDFRPVAIPLWLGHGDTDPVVTRAGSRVPFAQLTGKARTDAAGALLPEQGVLKTSSALVRLYAAANRFHGTEVRYTEYQYGNGEPFRELGMVTRHGHFTWEAGYKDQAIIEWMFAQRKVTAAP